uniref:Uncharacterized protein n=1 Tax=Physcomitrium patens TaxID=3218 RepID=A0A2K1KPC7_PHYPA|nr:hypothetical protein PHYPA_006503 [Physcomitrium patens]
MRHQVWSMATDGPTRLLGVIRCPHLSQPSRIQIKGIKMQWVSFLTSDPTIPSYATFSHGTVTARRKAQRNQRQIRGLDTISFIDSNNNQYRSG